jgi:uncharacterized protein
VSARLKGRRREVGRLLSGLRPWAAATADLLAIAVVGSYAYERPRMGSDLDLVLLTTRPNRYGPWLGTSSPLAPADPLRTQAWGPLMEIRLRRRTGLQLDVGVVLPTWASTNPLDPGTAGIVRDGLLIVYDPDRILARLRSTVAELPASAPGWRLPRIGPAQAGAPRPPP